MLRKWFGFDEVGALRLLTAAQADQIRALRYDNERLSRERGQAVAEARVARDTVTNWMSERMFGKPIFGGPSLTQAAPTPLAVMEAAAKPARQQARALARQMTTEFFEQYPETGVNPENASVHSNQ